MDSKEFIGSHEELCNELDLLQSPILGRQEIKPVLDELEKEFFDLVGDYREHEEYNEFKIKNRYYEDARE